MFACDEIGRHLQYITCYDEDELEAAETSQSLAPRAFEKISGVSFACVCKTRRGTRTVMSDN